MAPRKAALAEKPGVNLHFNRFDLNLLVALDALLQEKNVTRAAEKLFISQPAMSGSLQRLRERLDDPLLVRVGRVMELTPKAKALIKPVREILLLVQNTIDVEPVFNASTARRAFTVVMSDFVAVLLMPRVMRRLMREAPGIRLHIEPITSRAQDQLKTGDVDLVVRAKIAPNEELTLDEGLESQFLFNDTWVCAADAHHPTLGDTLSLEEYLELPHVSLNLGKTILTVESVALTQLSLDIDIVATAQNFATLTFMLPDTSLLTLISRSMAARMSENIPLKVFKPPFELPPLEEMMIWHNRDSEDAGHVWLRQLFLGIAQDIDPVQ